MLAASTAVTSVTGVLGILVGAGAGIAGAVIKKNGEIEKLRLELKARADEVERMQEQEAVNAKAAALALLREAASELVAALTAEYGRDAKLTHARRLVTSATRTASGPLAPFARSLANAANARSSTDAEEVQRELFDFRG